MTSRRTPNPARGVRREAGEASPWRRLEAPRGRPVRRRKVDRAHLKMQIRRALPPAFRCVSKPTTASATRHGARAYARGLRRLRLRDPRFSAGQAPYHREPAGVRTDRCAGRSSARARKRPRQNASSMTWGKQPHRTSFRSPVPSPHDRFGRARAACHAVANRERDADTEPIRRETGRPYFSRSTAKAEPQASSRVSDYSSALSRSTPGQVTTATPGTSPWASCQA